jgi:TetR/AcrR family transcriptional regulator, cholesterol catabolism regulator
MVDARSGRTGEAAVTTKAPVQGARWAQRRDEIVDVAAHLFAKQGYSATGTSELCDAVGLGKGSLYYYIGSKEEVLARIHSRVMEHVLQSASDIEKIDASPAEKLRLLGIELINVITRYPDHVWVFLHEWPALRDERAREFKRQRRLYEDAIERVLADGVAAGSFVIDDLRLAVHAWLGMHNYTYQWFRPHGRLNAFQIANAYHQVFLSGVTASGTSPATCETS